MSSYYAMDARQLALTLRAHAQAGPRKARLDDLDALLLAADWTVRYRRKMLDPHTTLSMALGKWRANQRLTPVIWNDIRLALIGLAQEFDTLGKEILPRCRTRIRGNSTCKAGLDLNGRCPEREHHVY